MQNTSHAVMAQRIEPADSNDFFPTPPWATRALCEFINPDSSDICWEPACGRGDMSRALEEYFFTVYSSDLYDYDYGNKNLDFFSPAADNHPEWIITNPPFNKAEQFALLALHRATVGVALLVRTSFLEGVGRYKRLFSPHPPTTVLQFSERVPMFKGRLSKTGSTATAYCWVIWLKNNNSPTAFEWIAPCRKDLEKDIDYARG